MMESQAALPLDAIVVTGFLGAGKTSFILHELLPSLAGRAEPVLLVNDAGEVNFDAERLATAGVPLEAVAGGCGCCELAGAMAEAVARLARQGRRPLIVEGSGLAEPGPLLHSLRIHGLHRVAVIGVIYGPTARCRLQEPLARAQLARADWMFVSAADTLSGAQAQWLTGELTALRNRPVSFWSFTGGIADPRWPHALALMASESPEIEGATLAATADIARRTLRPTGWATRAEWESWLRDLPADVWRVKGRVMVSGAVWPQALDHNGSDAPSWHDCEEPSDPYLVVIGAPRSLLQLPFIPAGVGVDLYDDAAWWPSAAADGRGDAGWAEGRPLPPRLAAQRWLEAAWRPAADDLVWLGPGGAGKVAGQRIDPPTGRQAWLGLAQRLRDWFQRHPSGRWLVGGWPLAHVQRLAGLAGLVPGQVWHAGGHWTWPDAALSCRLPFQEAVAEAGRQPDLRRVKDRPRRPSATSVGYGTIDPSSMTGCVEPCFPNTAT